MVPKPRNQDGPARILVVEDEVLVRSLLAEELREAGFVVVEAADAREALAFLDADGGVDLMFSDIRMPGQLSGLDLARAVRERRPDLPIVLTSGNQVSVPPSSLARFITKPYRMETAVQLVREELGRKRASGDGPPA